MFGKMVTIRYAIHKVISKIAFCFYEEFGDEMFIYIYYITKITSQITKISNYCLIWEALQYTVTQWHCIIVFDCCSDTVIGVLIVLI